MDEISLDKGFTGEDFSVLLHLVGRLDRDMLVRMTMDEIAEALELESAEVSRVLEKLIGMGILKCIGKDRNWVYVLNPKLDSNTLGLNVLKYLSTLRQHGEGHLASPANAPFADRNGRWKLPLCCLAV